MKDVCKNYIHKYKCDAYVENPNFCKDCEFKLPEEYLYDCETDEFVVFKNKYTGKEINVLKEEFKNILSDIIRRNVKSEWIKKPWRLCECPDGHEPENCKQERKKDFCECNWASIHYKFICKSCGYEPKGTDQDFLPNFCANCGAKMKDN